MPIIFSQVVSEGDIRKGEKHWMAVERVQQKPTSSIYSPDDVFPAPESVWATPALCLWLGRKTENKWVVWGALMFAAMSNISAHSSQEAGCIKRRRDKAIVSVEGRRCFSSKNQRVYYDKFLVFEGVRGPSGNHSCFIHVFISRPRLKFSHSNLYIPASGKN